MSLPQVSAISSGVQDGLEVFHLGSDANVWRTKKRRSIARATSPRFQERSDLESGFTISRLGEPHGKGSRCQAAERLLGLLLVGLAAPGFDHPARVEQLGEQLLVEAFLAQPAIERFDIGVLVRLDLAPESRTPV